MGNRLRTLMSKIVIFSKDDCPYCVRAKTLLNTKNIQFEEIVIGRDIDRDKFVATYPFVRSVPYILVDDTPIGGYEHLTEWVSQNEPQYLAE